MGIGGDTKAIHALCDALGEMLTWEDHRLYAQVASVSHWSPAQQLEHVVQAGGLMLKMIDLLEAGVPHENVQASGSPALVGRIVLLTGHIPRGRAQAPEATRPEAIPCRAGLVEAVEGFCAAAKARAERAADLRAIAGVGRHPALGWFRAAQWWRFLRIHSEHHLAIVADIDKVEVVAQPLAAPNEPLTRPSAP